MSNKVLLINPSYSPSYGSSKVGIVNPIAPTLGLATIAATAEQRGHKVEILDLSWRPYNFNQIRDHILRSKPDIVGVTAVTPLMNQLRDMSVLVKDISKNIVFDNHQKVTITPDLFIHFKNIASWVTFGQPRAQGRIT